MRRAIRWPALATAMILAAPAHVLAQGQGLWGGRLVHKVDSLAASVLENGPVASLAIGIKRGNQLLMARGYGLAELENRVPATGETIYRIGSITKQFTAAAVMQLVEQGRIGLDDPITKFLPDYPTQGNTVTIRHLLTHTSGIKSYTELRSFPENMKKDLSDDELIALFKNEPFDFKPGERYLYNNSAFYLLGVIIGKASGQPYREYLREHIFGPVGLQRTSYCDERPIIRGRAQGYQQSEGHLVNDDYLSMNLPGGAGAICSGVLDLLSWTVALRSGQVVSPASYQQMTTSMTLNNGSPTNYGFGLALGKLEGHPAVAHGGGINGFNTQLAHYPEADLDIVVLSNTNGPHADQVARIIARWVLGLEVVAVRDDPIPEARRLMYEGTYELRPGFELTVFAQGDQLFARATGQGANRMRWQGNDEFRPTFDDQVRLVFTVEHGKATQVTLYQGGRVTVGKRIN